MRNRFILVAAALTLAVPAIAQRRGQPVVLPEGPGKELVETSCGRCHGLNSITTSWGNTREGWRKVFGSMVALPTEDADAIAAYLGTHFPVKPAPEGKVIAGPAKVSFQEWVVPSLGSRPHDPLAARDGSIWWSGMFANVLGRLDPKTGEMKEFPVSKPRSGPHGLVEDKDGNIWYTANQSTYVGKLNPKTGAITEYPVPEGVRGPHTPIFDQKGTLFFTTQSGHVGRIYPATGEMKVMATPSSGTYPYGIQVNSKGVPWYVDFRGNRVGSVDPVTMQIKEYTLPSPDARPRRLALAPDDVVWYTDFARGYLGRFDPVTGKVKEWESPSGRESQPYGIAYSDGAIWYSESSVRPNTLVRFDPQTEKFQTWIIPAGGGVVRNMMKTPSGNNLVLAESGLNRVALVEIKDSGSK
ncbi:MAG: cytochrome C [Bryobacteraceae bacterium]